jgi:catechol 2,3-dioxygenase-like lactoylglutathione lyase family enzyme
MAEWEKQIGAINLIVRDVERSKAFYREVFGMPPQFEEEGLAAFRFKNEWIFLQHGPAHEDAPSDEARCLAQKGVGQFAIIVEDVNAVGAELDEHGVTVISGPADREWGMRTLTFADPGGYVWEIAEELPEAPGSS